MNAARPSADETGNGNGGTIRALLLETLNGVSLVQQQAASIIDEHGRAADSRAKLHDKVSDVITRLAVVEHTLGRIAPLVDEHEKRHQRESGGRAERAQMTKTGWALLTIAASSIAYGLDMLTKLFTGKH